MSTAAQILSLPVHVTWRVIVGGILAITFSVTALAAAITDMEVFDAVNAKRTPNYQIGFWERRWMDKEIRSDYRAHYPDGHLLKRYRVLTIASFAAFAGAVICFLRASRW